MMVTTPAPTLLKLVVDSASLITAAKFIVDGFTVAEHIAERCRLVIVPAVYNEVIIAGAAYQDAARMQGMITAGRITVEAPSISGGTVLDSYKLGQGEKESMILALTQPDLDYLVVDDRLAFIVSDRMAIRKVLLVDLLVELVWKELMERVLAEKILRVIESRYAPGFIAHTLRILEGGDRRCLT
jgi:predicted nucleic acid-binding protein